MWATQTQQDLNSFLALLKECAEKRDISRGIRVHAAISERGLLEKSSGALVSMYLKCGALTKAKELLHELPSRNVFTWTAVIAEYALQGQGQEALDCFECMQREGVPPNAVTFSCILKACGSIGAVDKGQQVHYEIVKQGLLNRNVVIGGALVSMYAKFGAAVQAHLVLDELLVRNVVSWNSLISAYAQQGSDQDVMNCFKQMQHEGLPSNAFTFAYILKACGSLKLIEKGEQIHNEIGRLGLLKKDVVLGGALVDMYVQCGALEKAQRVLEELPARDAASWSALIVGYVQKGRNQDALKCFHEMQREGICSDPVAFTCILKACGNIGAVDMGEQIHNEICRLGLLNRNVVLGGALVDMYARCGALAKAQEVLNGLPARDALSWNALITGYVQEGKGHDVLECFERMKFEGFSPDTVTFTCMSKACGTIGEVDKGEEIHNEITRQGLLRKSVVLGGALVDMYIRFGVLTKAQRVHEELPARSVVSWSALIAGYAQQGKIEDALNCFEGMQCEGFSPNEVTFSSMLYACSHTGLVDKGQCFFASMSGKHGIQPDLEHHLCMIDLFSRSGHLDKAVTMIEKMQRAQSPNLASSALWHTLLGACQNWKDVVVGRWAFEHALQLDNADATAYVLMANIYGEAGMHGEAEAINAMNMENRT